MRTEPQPAGRRPRDAVPFVQGGHEPAAPRRVDRRDGHAAAELGFQRGDDVEPGLSEPGLEHRRELRHARLDAVQPQPVPERGRRADRGQRRVVALPQRFELARAPRTGLDGVAPARGDDARPDLRDPVGADVEEPHLLRPAEPLVRAPGEGVAAEVAQIDVQRAPALRAVDVHVNPAAVGHLAQLAHREPQAAHVGNVRQGQHPGAGRQRALEHADQFVHARGRGRRRHPRHRQSVAGRPHLPGDVVGRVVLIPHHDFVAVSQGNPRVDDVVRLARVAHQRDLVRGDPELRRRRRARRLEQRAELRAVRERAVDVDVPRQLAHPLGHHARRRAQVGRVHRHPFVAERELPAHFLPERLRPVAAARLRAGGAAAGQDRVDDAAGRERPQESTPSGVHGHGKPPNQRVARSGLPTLACPLQGAARAALRGIGGAPRRRREAAVETRPAATGSASETGSNRIAGKRAAAAVHDGPHPSLRRGRANDAPAYLSAE